MGIVLAHAVGRGIYVASTSGYNQPAQSCEMDCNRAQTMDTQSEVR